MLDGSQFPRGRRNAFQESSRARSKRRITLLQGRKGRAHCLPLLAVLKAAEPRLNPKVKNHLLAFTAFVRAEDGYTVSFSLGELQPDVGKREVWIALDRDNLPIPDADGPVELLVITDEKPARWLHNVSRLILIDGIAATEKF